MNKWTVVNNTGHEIQRKKVIQLNKVNQMSDNIKKDSHFPSKNKQQSNCFYESKVTKLN